MTKYIIPFWKWVVIGVTAALLLLTVKDACATTQFTGLSLSGAETKTKTIIVEWSDGGSWTTIISKTLAPGANFTDAVNRTFGSSTIDVRFRQTATSNGYVSSGNSYIFDAENTEGEDYILAVVHFEADQERGELSTSAFDGRSLNPDSAKTIWKQGESELTGDLFREGVDKIVAFVAASGSGGGGGGDPAASSDREAVATSTIEANQLTDFTDLTPETSLAIMESQGASAKSSVESLFPAKMTGLGGVTFPSEGKPSILAITMPESFGGKEIDFNPFTEDRLGPVATWFRLATSWLSLILLGIWMWKEVGGWSVALNQMRQAKGNTVVAGTGAQATALAAAGLLTVIIVVGITALLGGAIEGVTASQLLSVTGQDPFTAIPAGIYWMCNQILPVPTLLLCILVKIAFNAYAPLLYNGSAALARFIVP